MAEAFISVDTIDVPIVKTVKEFLDHIYKSSEELSKKGNDDVNTWIGEDELETLSASSDRPQLKIFTQRKNKTWYIINRLDVSTQLARILTPDKIEARAQGWNTKK